MYCLADIMNKMITVHCMYCLADIMNKMIIFCSGDSLSLDKNCGKGILPTNCFITSVETHFKYCFKKFNGLEAKYFTENY